MDLESLTEKLETSSPAGNLVFHVFGALAEFERNLIRERTMAGLKAARARGRKGGRPRKLSPKELKTIAALLKAPEVSVQEIAKRYGVSRSNSLPQQSESHPGGLLGQYRQGLLSAEVGNYSCFDCFASEVGSFGSRGLRFSESGTRLVTPDP